MNPAATTPRENMTDVEQSAPKFQVFDRVYARDKDGLMYEAIIRRCLYGVAKRMQVQMGLISYEESEAARELQDNKEPTYFYYVHYLKWSEKFDSWVAEEDVYVPGDHIAAYAQRLAQEHKALRQAHTKKAKNKKAFQTIDGESFLRDWGDRMAVLNRDFGLESRLDKLRQRPIPDALQDLAPLLDANRRPRERITKQLVMQEKELRPNGLTLKRGDASRVPLSLGLKRILVEQWEVVTQCGSVGILPASVTVRDALDLYVQSKGASALSGGDTAAPAAAQADTNNVIPPSEPEQIGNQQQQEEEGDTHTQWTKMADGLASFFDEALPQRLLFQEEIPQLNLIETDEQLAGRRYSEIYGPEYLLRLLVRLPVLMDGVLTDAESRPVLGKINDFVRFCSKNECDIFRMSYRKLNALESIEKERLERHQHRRRKRHAAESREADAKSPRRNKEYLADVSAVLLDPATELASSEMSGTSTEPSM